MAEITPVEIPDRPLFKASEVCELAKLQPYVLRSWEAEFRDLGVTRTGSTTRVYRREDVERVLRIKHLVLIEGLTLAGVRRKFAEEQESPLDLDTPIVAARPAITEAVRERLERVRNELRALLQLLNGPGGEGPSSGALVAAPSAVSEFSLASPGTQEPAKPKRSRRKEPTE
jgi:DNA-binding transcriptional MerR regulator